MDTQYVNIMDTQYDSMFDLKDFSESDEKYYHKLIPTVDVSIFRKVLNKDLDVINKSKLTMQQWVKV